MGPVNDPKGLLTEALEIKLVLEKVILCVCVLRTIAVVDLII